MAIRDAVRDFVTLGPLPPETASEEAIAAHQAKLEKIQRPASDEEAAVLVRSFGPDECYGLAWTLLHLIESAPGASPIETAPRADDNDWVRRLWDRSHR